jgi:hypothetical protein
LSDRTPFVTHRDRTKLRHRRAPETDADPVMPCAATMAAKARTPETRAVVRAKPKRDIGGLINGFGIGNACRSISRSSPQSIVGDIRRRRPLYPNYNVHSRDLTA